MRPRLYLPEFDDRGCGTLDEDESGHLTRVLRLGLGAEIDVFDGRGTMRRARVVGIERRRVLVAVLESAPCAAEPAVHLTMAISVLKGDKMDAVVRDLAMIGAAAVQPIVSARSEMSLAVLVRSHRVERWRRIAIAGAKQSGRAVVPSIAAPLTLSEWLRAEPDPPLLVLVEPSAGRGAGLGDVPAAPAVRLLVGPEGGWSEEELAAFAAANATAVSLGARTLRADAAPIVAVAALFEAWDGW